MDNVKTAPVTVRPVYVVVIAIFVMTPYEPHALTSPTANIALMIHSLLRLTVTTALIAPTRLHTQARYVSVIVIPIFLLMKFCVILVR